MSKFLPILKWFIGVFLIISGISTFGQTILGGIVITLSGLLVIPITLSLIEKTIKKELPKFLRIGLPIVLLLVGMGFVSVEKQRQFDSLPQHVKDSINNEKKKSDSINLVLKEKRDKENQLRKTKEDSLKKISDRKEFVEKYFSPMDGSHVGVRDFIKENMNDPDSYDHVKTTYIDFSDYLVVTTKFRGKNKFGATVLQEKTFKVDYNGNVIEMLQ